MADTTTVYLVGGPCDGQTKKLTGQQMMNQRTWCKGKLYSINYSLATNAHPVVFQYFGDMIAKDKTNDKTPVTHAWSRWMHALGHTGPASHRRIRKSTARVRRIARKR